MEKADRFTLWSADTHSRDACLRRLTSGLWNKARSIQPHVERGTIGLNDYVVVALSGFALSQESPAAPEANGDFPEFVRAFLPVGERFVTVSQTKAAALRWGPGGYRYSSVIEQFGTAPVTRDAFLTETFAHIDAVAYTPLRLPFAGSPFNQVGVLHNPRSIRAAQRMSLRMGNDYVVRVTDEAFELVRL